MTIDPCYSPLPPAGDHQLRGYAAHGFALCALRRELDFHGATIRTNNMREPITRASTVARVIIADAIDAWASFAAPTALDVLYVVHTAFVDHAAGSVRVDGLTFEIDHVLREHFAAFADRVAHAIARTNMVAG